MLVKLQLALWIRQYKQGSHSEPCICKRNCSILACATLGKTTEAAYLPLLWGAGNPC